MHTTTPTGRGRLSPEREGEVYEAVVAELIENGYERFSYDNVAALAHCSKATLYRLWDGKVDLVVNALLCDKGVAHDAEDHGNLRADMHAWAKLVVKRDQRRTAVLILTVARACLKDPELAKVVREQLLGVDAELDGDGISRAIARGEIAADNPAIQHVMLAVVGPLMLFELVTGKPLTAKAFIDYLDAIVLPALEAADPEPLTTR